MSRESFYNVDARDHISGTSEATVAKFCMQVEYYQVLGFRRQNIP